VTQGSIGVWLSIAAQARRENAAMSVPHAIVACARAAGAGAALSMPSACEAPEPVFATDTRSGELEELQATLGEGPSVEAMKGDGPVFADNMTNSWVLTRWPELAPAAQARGLTAIFAIPVCSGAARVGVLSLYRERPGRPSADELSVWLLYADAVLMLALDDRGALAPGAVELVGRGFTGRRAEVHQAAGMISVQMAVPITEALVALRARAYVESRPISEVAADVVARRLSFTALGNTAPQTMPPSADGGTREQDTRLTPPP